MGYEKRQFLYGMDFDTEERLVEQGFTRKNVNVRIGSSSGDGVLSAENVQGNKLIPNVELPEGDNKVIGSYWYELKNLNYYFVWNSEGNHGIYEYDHVPSKITRVMIAEVLNFQQDALVTGINVVEFDDTNDLLYWLDGYNPPRKINIQKAKADGYVTPISESVIDSVKYPPLFPPTAVFQNDSAFLSNYFEDTIWQFKAAYVYDDKEVSAFSPISIQVLPSASCSGVSSQGNTIKIVIPKGGELVERVIVAGREGNLNDFLEIKDQEVGKYELDSDGNYVYYFRNDGVYNALDLNKSVKLFDNVPQVAKAQEFIKNRITYGNITEGYDNVDVDFNLNVSYAEEVEEPKNTIKGVLRIAQPARNSSTSLSQFENYQPITNYEGNIVFGGFGQVSNILGDEFETDLAGSFKQILPLGGFCLYLAGTDYYAISQQKKGVFASRLQDSNGVYTSDKKSERNSIRQDILSKVYSTWKFENVPDGTYILRVASHLTTKTDLLDPDRAYQKTSTFLNRIGFGVTTNSGQYAVKELPVTVSGGQILDDIEVVICDMSAPSSLKTTRGLAGYLIDAGTGYTPAGVADALGQKRVELSAAWIERKGSVRDRVVTDHNGFFFNRAAGNKKLFLNYLQTGIYKNVSFNGYDLFTATPGAVENNSDGSIKYFIVSSNNSNVNTNARTNVIVTVKDSSGNPVSGITVVSTNGDVQTTQTSGEAPFIVYAPAYDNDRTVDFLTYTESTCKAEFSPSVVTFNDYIQPDGTTTFMPDITVTFLNVDNVAALKNGGVYSYGLVYYDRANRSGATNLGDNSELRLPFYTEVVPAITKSPIVEWEIRNNPPSWATHYQWVRTPNTSVNNYIQWYTDQVTYSGGSANYNDAEIIELDITNLSSEYKDAYPDSVLSYDFTSRDRVRLIKDSNQNYFEEYIDLKVIGFDTGVLKVENDIKDIDLEKGVFFEIYTPKLDVEEDVYYEIGECYEIGEVVAPSGDVVKYHKGGIFDQNPFTGSPATGVFKGGDTYYRNRNIYTSSTKIYRTQIDSQLFSDFWQSKVSDIGRPNIVDKDAKRVTRPTTIYYSERFIPETNINGLNSFFDTSFETYARENGSIQKLYADGNRLDCLQELRVGAILVEEGVTYTPDGNPILSYSDNFLNKIQYYAMKSGTMNPESFAVNEGRRYFFDIRNGKAIRLSTDGMTAISDNKMHNYFESKSNFYSAFNLIPEIWGAYDRGYDEYVICFGEVSRPEGFTPDELALVSSQAETVTEVRDGLTYTFIIGYGANEQGTETDFEIVRDLANGTYVINSSAGDLSLDRQKLLSIPAETIGFSENTKHWTSFYTFTPECAGRVGIDFLTFRNGQCFLHNQTGDRNTFYGERTSSEVWVVFNQDPSNNKVFQALSEESDSVWEAREILTQKGQKSNLILDDFAVDYGQGHTLYSKENIHYAALWQDENTPNVDLPLINGDSMRDVSIVFKLINDSVDQERLYAASVRYSLSPRTNR